MLFYTSTSLQLKGRKVLSGISLNPVGLIIILRLNDIKHYDTIWLVWFGFRENIMVWVKTTRSL